MTSTKIISRNADEKLIRAFVRQESGAGFYPMTFSPASVDGVIGIGEQGSGIVLRSGITIPVALSYAELEEKIYGEVDFREPVLDLCPVTGEAALAVTAPHLAKKINANNEETGLKIIAFLRKDKTNEVVSYEFSETNIVSMEPLDTARSKCGRAVTLCFNTAAAFNSKESVLDMPYDDFIYMLNWAKQSQRKTLDLCDTFAKNPGKYGLKPQ